MLLAYRFVLLILIYQVCSKSYEIFIEQKIPHLTINKLYSRTKKEALLREEEEKRHREEEGRREKVYFLRRMDLLIERSGITSKIPFINTGTYLMITFTLILVFTGGVLLITDLPIMSLMMGLIILFLSYLILYLMSGINYRATEKNILEFTNLLENYSKTNHDIITILNKVYPYLNNPLHDAVEACVIEARSSGDVSKALLNLEHKIELEKFKEIIRNIEICSRYEANYEEIIKDSRKMLRDYIAAREERRALIKNSRIEMVIILFCGILIINMLDNFSEIGIFNVLIHSLIGNVILAYCIVVLFLGFWVLLAIDK